MKDTVTVNNVELTYAQIEAAHAEMVKQKAEKEIKVWDIVKVKGHGVIGLVSEINPVTREYFVNKMGWLRIENIKKVTGTPEFMSELRTKLEGK